MTAPELPRPVGLDPIPNDVGCMGPQCRRQFTVQLHPFRGRLCPSHATLPTIPPGDYRRDFALDLVDLGHADAAFDYLRAHLAWWIDERYATAAGRFA